MRIIVLIIICLTPLLSEAKKIKIKVDPTYVKTKKTPYKESWTDAVVQSFNVSIDNSTYRFTAENDSMTVWNISLNQDEYGSVTFNQINEDRNQWKFEFGMVELAVSFYGYNDPREFKFETNEGDYMMASGEPDCNSIFILYDYLEENLWDYDYKKAAAEGYADEACRMTAWKFTINKEGIAQEVMLSYIFTSVVAQNVRAFKY